MYKVTLVSDPALIGLLVYSLHQVLCVYFRATLLTQIANNIIDAWPDHQHCQ